MSGFGGFPTSRRPVFGVALYVVCTYQRTVCVSWFSLACVWDEKQFAVLADGECTNYKTPPPYHEQKVSSFVIGCVSIGGSPLIQTPKDGQLSKIL